jgi:hypothetical protein
MKLITKFTVFEGDHKSEILFLKPYLARAYRAYLESKGINYKQEEFRA